MGMASIERRMDAFGRLCGNSKTVSRLVIVNVAIYILLLLSELFAKVGGSSATFIETLVLLPSPFEAMILKPWTLFTYMVTQLSLLHLLFNMLFLIGFGGLLRDVIDDRKILLVYIGSGLAGGLLFEIVESVNGTSSTLVGSSAAVLGIMAADAILMPDRKVRLFLIGDCKLKWFAIAMILLTCLGGGWQSGEHGALAAHLGGTAFGMAAALMIRSGKFDKRSHTSEKPRQHTERIIPTLPAAGVRRVAKVLEKRLSDKERLDELLDKIRISGYASLSRQEQQELEEISKRIKK